MPTLDEYARAGIQAINDRKYDVAIDSFKSAIALDPTRPDMNNALGMAYVHRGEVGTALPYLETSVALARGFDLPEHQEMRRHFHMALATAYELLDRALDAERILQEAVASWPTVPEPRIQLGQVQLAAGQLDDGLATYDALATFEGLDEDGRDAAEAVSGSVRAYLESEADGSAFLRAHADTYRQYFDEVSRQPVEQGWYAEAARMARGADGEIRPLIPQGARKYAMQRVDLVNPNDGNAMEVHNAQEPMITAVNGLEPLAQVSVLVPWKGSDPATMGVARAARTGHPFEVWVCTRCPWHWLPITVQFHEAATEDVLVDDLDQVMGEWYLAGFNGEFGDKDSGRFHFITDPEPISDRAVSYTVDLGRARYEAIESLLKRLVGLNERRAIRRVLLGKGHLLD